MQGNPATDLISPPPAVAGYSLNGTTYTISAADNAAVCASTGTPPAPNGDAHPVFFYIATQVGMGQTVAGLCDLCEFDVGDGPLLVGSEAEFFGALKVGATYDVVGEILSLTRKTSRGRGVMDLLTYRLSLKQGDTVVLTATNNWFLPREKRA